MSPQDTGRQLWRNPDIVSCRQFRDIEVWIQLRQESPLMKKKGLMSSLLPKFLPEGENNGIRLHQQSCPAVLQLIIQKKYNVHFCNKKFKKYSILSWEDSRYTSRSKTVGNVSLLSRLQRDTKRSIVKVVYVLSMVGGGTVLWIQTFRRIRIRKNHSGFGYEMSLK